MGRRICAPSPVPTSSSSQSVTEPQVPTLSRTMPAPTSQSVIESMSRSYDASVQQSLKKLHHHSFVITDPHLPGHPIVYASDTFLHMSGYLAEEVLGRNPKFLQGPDTDRQSVCQVRDSISEGKPCHVVLLNYTKQGWPFQIVLHMAPVVSQNDGRLLHFVGAQTPLFDYSTRLKKQAVQSAPTLLGLQKGPDTFLGQKGVFNTENAGLFGYLPYSNDLLQTGSCTGSQKKKKMKVALTVLQLVIHELTKSSERKCAEVLRSRYLSETAETALCSSLTLALTRIQQSFVISNPNVPGMPIIYASDMFLRLTGYQKDEVIGRNCRFLQGQDTDACVVQQIRDCIKAEKACTVRILNYKKDRSPFWNLLHVAPVRDHTAKIAYFVGVQWELGSDCCQTSDIAPVMQQLGAVGAIKVAVKGQGLRRSFGP
uniref:Putative LOV domain-containing protein n=1 Tax=Struthiopteris spicant TaxID=114457 RepID=A0A126X2S6_STRUS|nr:putative LOV domain-containing protein [Struthiopteris spicant]